MAQPRRRLFVFARAEAQRPASLRHVREATGARIARSPRLVGSVVEESGWIVSTPKAAARKVCDWYAELGHDSEAFAVLLSRALAKVPANQRRGALVAAINAAGHEAHMTGRVEPHRDGMPVGAWVAMQRRYQIAALNTLNHRARKSKPSRSGNAVKKGKS